MLLAFIVVDHVQAYAMLAIGRGRAACVNL